MGHRYAHVWFGARYTHTLVLNTPIPAGATLVTPLETRGHFLYERHLSSLVKDSHCCLELARMPPQAARTSSSSTADGQASDPSDAVEDEGLEWASLRDACTMSVSHPPPMAPPAFERMLREGVEREAATAGSGIYLQNPSDCERVIVPGYRSAFLQLIGQARFLDFQERQWGDAEIETLASALQYAHEHNAATNLEELQLSHNSVSDAGFRALADLLAQGALGKLKGLELEYNVAGVAGRRAVKEASKRRAIACHV